MAVNTIDKLQFLSFITIMIVKLIPVMQLNTTSLSDRTSGIARAVYPIASSTKIVLGDMN